MKKWTNKYGVIGNAIIWLLGYHPDNKREDAKGADGLVFFRRYPESFWDIAPYGDYFTMTIRTHRAPCFAHRWMQRLLLGVKYKRFWEAAK